MKSKAPWQSVVALILGILALYYVYKIGSTTFSGFFRSLSRGTAIDLSDTGVLFILPSVGALIAGINANAFAHSYNSRVLTLVSSLLYTASLILFPMWGFVAIPSMVFQFWAYAKMSSTDDSSAQKDPEPTFKNIDLSADK